ncbi:glycosyltransferase family 39 protein [Candidatus Sumerlaeota bacterium]|nr:glycosyltransferase family 39 protein [Candidatus Sumerlaeota bacterium]
MREQWKTFQAGWETVREKMRRPDDKKRESSPNDPRVVATRRSETIAAGLLGLLVVVHCVFAGSLVSKTYLDIGDGNYMYTASRMADGLTIYRDFLSPQPPLHLVVGSVLVRLSRLFGEGLYEIPPALVAIRVFSIALRAAIFVLIYLLGRRLTQTPYGGAVAAWVYAFLPIGLWWSIPYESEPLEIFWLLLSLWLFLSLEPRRMALSGCFMALAVLTNMTAAPYALATILYLIVRHRWRLFLHFLVPCAAVVFLIAGYYQIRTGAYYQNVVFNQVGSFPRTGLASYVFGKIASQGAKILFREGGFILLALLGLILYNRTDNRSDREYVVWYALALLCSVFYVSKGGTADYIFSIAEPAVALFVSYFLCQFFYPSTFRRFLRRNVASDTSAIAQGLFMLLVLALVLSPGLSFIHAVVTQKRSESGPFEQTEADVASIENRILYHTKAGDRILSDPYYAFLTGRLLIEEYSELYLWCLKYDLERWRNEPGEAAEKVERIARELEGRRIPIVVANESPANPLTLRVPEIRRAIDKFYKPVFGKGELPKTMSFTMQVFVPRTDAELDAEP